MHRFLFGLAQKKSTRSGILSQSGLGLCTIVGHPFTMFQKRQEPGDGHPLIITDQHEKAPLVGSRSGSSRSRDIRYGIPIASGREPVPDR